jgi:iron complex outermembrane receptor protein
MRIRHFGLVIGLLSGTSAFAQDAQPAPAPATPAAQEGDIVVTAQRRAQSLQDVSLAVTAIEGDRLADAQINNLQDLQSIVPTVNFGSDFNQAKIFIRGVGANTSTTGNSTGVALHVDGAYVARAEAQLTSLFDLDRVEVLRGPQGTLYGRNAVGGSINLITARPTHELGGYARLTYGNYNSIVTEAAISGPITDHILFRIAGKTEDRDGFGINPVSGADVDDLNRRMIRGHLQFDVAPNSYLLLTGEYFRQNDSSGAVHFLRATFPGVPRLAPLGIGGYAVNPRDLATESQPGTQTETYSFTGTVHIEATPHLSFTSIANYRNFKSSLFQDLDLSAVIDSLQTNGQNSTIQERRIDSEQYSLELQTNYSSDAVNAVLGAYYFNERQRPIDNVGFQRRNGEASAIPLLQAAGVDLNEAYALCGYFPSSTSGGTSIIAPKRVCIHSNLGTEAVALFGQATINLGALTPALSTFSLKLGGRFSHEHVDSANPSIIIAAAGRGPVIRSTVAGTFRERSFEDFTPEIGLEWRPTPGLLVYYTYSEGFKAGSGENAAGSTTIVDPEQIQNHEIGLRATLLDRRLVLSASAYTYDLQGAQLNKTISGGPSGFQTIFQNAAETTGRGFELEVALRPVSRLRLNGSIAYTDAHFVDYLTLDPLNPANVATPGSPAYNPVTNPDPTAFGAPGGGNIQLAGNQVRNTPKWAWSVHGEYEIPVSPLGGTVTLQGDVYGRSRVFFSEYQRDLESSPSYTMADASIVYANASDTLRLQLWVRNLTDVDRPSSTFALATGRLIGITYLPPRTYGISVGFRF